MSLSTTAVLAAEEGHSTLEVMLHTLPAGLIAAGVFFLLAMVTLSYRNVANRHSGRIAETARTSGHGDAHEDKAGH